MVNLTVLSYYNASPYHEVRRMYKAQSRTDLCAAATRLKENIGSQTPVINLRQRLLRAGSRNVQSRKETRAAMLRRYLLPTVQLIAKQIHGPFCIQGLVKIQNQVE